MTSTHTTTPIGDTVPKVNSEIAVGEDPEFQRKWWRFEKLVWIAFSLIVLFDLAGAFGRGPLSQAFKTSGNGEMNVRYERIERAGTPSVMKVDFGQSAIQNRQIQLWVSETLITKLGNKQIAPQPATSAIGQGGVQYLFPATVQPATVVFSLQPSAPGLYRLALKSKGSELDFKILVMP